MQSLWYLSRATGVVSILLLTVVMVLGVVVNRQGRIPGFPQFAVTGVHRNASLLAVVFLGVHIVTAIIDPYAPIKVIDAFVPFVSAYMPLWIGLGALALDMLIAVVITSLVRVRMGHRTWRAIHWLAYAIWPIALLHGYRTGTDLRSGVLFAVTLASIGAVAVAAGWRVVSTLRAVPHPARTHAVLDEQRTRHRSGKR